MPLKVAMTVFTWLYWRKAYKSIIKKAFCLKTESLFLNRHLTTYSFNVGYSTPSCSKYVSYLVSS